MRENALLDFFNPIIISQGRKIVKGTIGENGDGSDLENGFLGLCSKPHQEPEVLGFPATLSLCDS